MRATFSVFDTETTGFSPARGDRLLEIAVVSLDERGSVMDRWVSRVNPQRRVGATHIHGITQAEANRAPVFAEVAEEVWRRTEGTLLVAHNAAFDMRFLSAEFQRLGVQVSGAPAFCTMKASRALYPSLASHRLADVCRYRGIELVDAHSALADTVATATLFQQMLGIADRHFATREIPALVARARTNPWRDTNLV